MKVLVLHNNNVPFFLRNPVRNQVGNITFREKLLKFDSNLYDISFDTYISSELSFLIEESYDLIILPFTISEVNYLEYTGLRIASHIRLTPAWKKLTTPLLFLGPDTIDDVTKLSPFGLIVNSYHVFMTDKKEEQQLIAVITNIINNYPGGDDDSFVRSNAYKTLLDSLSISSPANYTTHHSIANEWAIIRWRDMFAWEEEPILANQDFLNMLYFKHIMMLAGQRDSFSKKKKLDYKIGGIEHCNIVYIDDEVGKWHKLLNNIFSNSGAFFRFYPFTDEQKGLEKKELIEDIKQFIKEDYDKYGGADCYLLDLRLHDNDFEEGINPKDLSGHQIARFIKDKMNPYNQIVVFTASNKVWNIKEDVIDIGACGYVVKETPEQNLNKNDSYKVFIEFAHSILHAKKMSYLRSLYTDLVELEEHYNYTHEELSMLYEFLSILGNDDGKNQPEMLRASLLTIMAYIEVFMKQRFELTETELFKEGETKPVGKWQKRIFFKTEKEGKFKIVKEVQCYDSPYKSVNPGWESPDYTKDIAQIVIPIFIYYGFPEEKINNLLSMKNERNWAAHQGICNINKDQLVEFFKEIILPILKMEESKRKIK